MSVTYPRGGASKRKLATMHSVINRLIARGGQQPSAHIVQASLTELNAPPAEHRIAVHTQIARVVDVLGSPNTDGFCEVYSVMLFLDSSLRISSAKCTCRAAQYHQMCHHMLTALTVVAHQDGLKLSV